MRAAIVFPDARSLADSMLFNGFHALTILNEVFSVGFYMILPWPRAEPSEAMLVC